MNAMHSLLKRQLKRHFGDQVAIPAEWRAFLDGVNEAYLASDADRAMLECSLELSSQEMLNANSEMRAVFEAIPDLVFRLDQEGVILDIKAGAAGDLMVKRENLIGKRIQNTPLKHVARQFAEAVQRVVAENAPVIIEYSAVLQGQESHYEARLVPIPNRQIVVIIRNITERKQSLRLLGAAVEQTTESILITDAELDLPGPRILFVNPAFTKMTGYTAAEVLGKSPRILQGPKSDLATLRRLRETLDRGETFTGETVNYRKDGTEFHIEWQVAPIRDTGGKITHFVGIQRDITERKRAETALRESETRYHALFDGSADGIVIADSETKAFKYGNPALCRMLGYTQDELRTLGVASIHPPESLPHVVAEFEAQARGDKTLAADLPCLRKDGSVFLADVNATKVTIDGRPCNVGFFRDITARKQAEEAQRAGVKRLRALNVLQGLLLHPNSLEHKLKLVTEAVVQIVGADFARIWMIAPGDRCTTGCVHAQVTEGPHVCRFRERCLHLLASSGRYTHTNGDHGRVPFGCYKIGKIASGEESKFLTNDAANDPRVHNHVWAKELGLVAFAGYRLVDSEGKPLGVLALFSQRAISAEEDLFLEGIAHATSQVLRSAQAEDKLRQSEERFRQFADQSSEVIWFTELNPERILFINRMVETVWGLPAERFYQDARVWTAALHPEDQPRVHEAWEACLQGRSPRYEAEYRVVRPDGSIRWVLDGGRPIRNETGDIVRLSGVARDITERKQIETVLAYERDLLRTLLDQSPDHIYFKDAQSRFLKASQTMARQFKMASPEEMVGKTDFDFFTEAHARPAFEDEQEIIRTGVPMIGKVEQEVWQDGRETWCLTTKMPFRNKDGEIIGTFGISKDITALKQIENTLTHERDLFKTLMDQFPDSIYFKDLQSRFVRVSKSKVERAFTNELPHHAAAHPGGNREKLPAHLASRERFAEYLLGKTDFDIFAEAHARPAFEDEQEIIRTGIPMIGKIEKEVWLDGHETWALTSKMPWRDQDGKIIGTFGISKDITAMKLVEEQLRQLSQAVEQSPASIVITDPAGNITYVNPKFTAVTGYTFAEALGKNPRILKSGETPPAAYAELWQTITSGKEWRGEFHNKRKNGELYWESASISPICDATGKITHFLAVKEDTTERKLMEVRLFQSQKMETVGKLAGGIAHEFNSILTAIIGQSELLGEDLPAGSPLAKNAANITVAAGRAATLTRQLLAYGRKQLLRPEILDLNQVITSMDEVLRHLMGGETTGVNIVPAPGLHAVKADAGQIEQVIINLAMNAHDAMPNGGKLTLETANISFDQDSVGRYPELKPGDYVMLAISDTGVGMSAEVKAHVFEPFFTTKSVGQGTGLGLSTCYGIVKQSGGHISVYSEPGRGSTFKIYLPKTESSEKVPAQHPIPTNLPRGTETILLVEDDPALREMMAALLRRLGYTVLAAANGVEALNLKQQRDTGHIDLLFTDVVMPHMSGKELADRVRVLYPHTRILFTSAYTEHAIIHQGMLDQGVVLLQKPFTPAALAHKVREVLNQPGAPKPEPA